MKFPNSAVRAIRTACQAAAAGLLALPVVTSLTEIVSLKEALLVVAYQTGLAGLVSFLQNIAEDKTSLSIPK